eukprot:6824292-Alexandrium_andersonii.AAC.1
MSLAMHRRTTVLVRGQGFARSVGIPSVVEHIASREATSGSLLCAFVGLYWRRFMAAGGSGSCRHASVMRCCADR